MTKVKTTTINTKVMCSKRKRVTFARGDTFARGHFCTKGNFCTNTFLRGFKFARGVTFAQRHFYTVKKN